MAQPIQRPKITQPAARPKRQFLPEATAVGEAARQILTKRFGGVTQPWIEQVVFAVQSAVQNGIENLSGSSVATNNKPSDAYRFPARNAEELKATAHLVPQVKIEDLPVVDEYSPTIVLPQSKPQPPIKGWIL